MTMAETDPILVDCEGANTVAKNVRKDRGVCSFCNERVPLNPDCVGAAPHQRWDVEAMIARGDYR